MPLFTYPICWPLVSTSHYFPGCGHHPAVIMSSRGRGWSLAKGRSLSLPISHGTIFCVNSRKLNAPQLLNVSLNHFHSIQRIFKTDYVMRLRSTSRRRTKSHHVMLCYVMSLSVTVVLWLVTQMAQWLEWQVTVCFFQWPSLPDVIRELKDMSRVLCCYLCMWSLISFLVLVLGTHTHSTLTTLSSIFHSGKRELSLQTRFSLLLLALSSIFHSGTRELSLYCRHIVQYFTLRRESSTSHSRLSLLAPLHSRFSGSLNLASL